MSRVTFGSVCSGIEAASVAWNPIGWDAAWFSEVEPFPCAVLAAKHPHVANVGDLRTVPGLVRSTQLPAPDILCGGTPCQSFSVAGLRKSLEDPRGNLSLVFCDLANAIDERRQIPSVIFWENVPGVLSTKDNAFGCFLAGLAGEDSVLEPPGGRWANAGCVHGPQRSVAWRVLDAQYFGLAQRRKRVFVIASARPGFDPTQVLFEFTGVRRDHPPSRDSGSEVADALASGATPFGGGNTAGPINVATACGAKGGPGHNDFESETFVAHTLRGEGFDASEDGTGRGTPLVLAFDTTSLCSAANRSNPQPGDPSHTLCGTAHPPAIAFHGSQDPDVSGDVTHPVGRNRGLETCAFIGARVRRLMPSECEVLQGFERGYTNIIFRGKPAADGPRYKAIGNSWAVPVVRWIGERIQAQLK